jgi:hypothetical protein
MRSPPRASNRSRRRTRRSPHTWRSYDEAASEVLSRFASLRTGSSSAAGHSQPGCDRADNRWLHPDDSIPRRRGLPRRLAGRHCHPHIVLHDGSGGISSIQPGNITGVPSLAATGTTGASGGAVATITVGSGPMMPPPRASLWSLATRSPTTPRMLPPSSAGRPGIDPPSCPPVSSIGATSRRPRPHHPRRKRLANGRAGLRAGVLSIRPRFG